ncbi:MAG: heme o synthase [Gemmatimonadota bacterium]|nr:heme o synthase [Gemmatimonadota bacterium]
MRTVGRGVPFKNLDAGGRIPGLPAFLFSDRDRAVDHAEAQTEAKSDSRRRAYYELTKPGIAGYVMITAGVSAYVGSRGDLSFAVALHTMAGIGLATAGALTLNQYVEREADAVMERTKGRPLPTARVQPLEALAFGTLLLFGGLVYLTLTLGALPSMLTAASGLMYHGVYTPLKTRSFVATLAGAVPGALPMLIGWTAATGTIDGAGLAMFAIGYLWQLPHVLGLAWMLREDYARVGFKLVPPGGGRAIGLMMIASTALLIPASWTPTLLGYTGTLYVVGATLLGLGFLTRSLQAAREMSVPNARRVFFASLLYHPLLLSLMLFDTFRL